MKRHSNKSQKDQKSSRKLKLERETVRELSSTELNEVAGGRVGDTAGCITMTF